MSVLKNKNRVGKENKRRRADELQKLKSEAVYRAKLSEDIKIIQMMLEDEDVDGIVISIPQQHKSKFLKAMYHEEMQEFSIRQIDGDRFRIERKLINF